MKKSCRKCAPNASPRPLLNFGKSSKTAFVYKKFFQKNILKEDYQEVLKKWTLFFLSNPLPLKGQSYQKQRGLELVTNCSSSYKTSSEKFLY